MILSHIPAAEAYDLKNNLCNQAKHILLHNGYCSLPVATECEPLDSYWPTPDQSTRSFTLVID